MRLAGEEPRGEVPANGVESTPLSKGSVGDNAIGRRLAVDLENGRDGENGGRSPGAIVVWWCVSWSGYETSGRVGVDPTNAAHVHRRIEDSWSGLLVYTVFLPLSVREFIGT